MSELKIKVASLTSENRQVENQLSELTAEQARQLTCNSQLKRNHQYAINQLDQVNHEYVLKIKRGIYRVLNCQST